MHLIWNMEKRNKEMTFLEHQIKKADLENELLEHWLEASNLS